MADEIKSRIKHNILIIDDDKDVCSVLMKSLKSFGYNTSYSLTGKDGITALKNKDHDVVLLDLILPDINGKEVLTQIRRFNKDIMVIILTAYATVESAIETLKDSRACDYIQKPFNIEELHLVIEKAIRSKELNKQLMKIPDLGQKVKHLRRAKSLSLDALAKNTQLSKGFLSEMERGRKHPRLDTLQNIATALGVNLYFFLNK